jgi:hypothetical protein
MHIEGDELITREDAELLVDSWARTASRGEGGVWTPMLEEFELGYVAWVRQPEGVRAEPGSGVRQVIDRYTGEVTPWGSVPAPMVAEHYRRHRANFPAGAPTVDPVASIRLQATHGLAPTTAVHLTLAHDRRMRIAYGAKGDQELNHHPVVRSWLDAHPPGHLARGAERHAELIVLSDILHSYDAATGEPTTPETAANLFRDAVDYRKTRVRAGDSSDAVSCYSCVEAWVRFGIFPPSLLAKMTEVDGFAAGRYRPGIPQEVLEMPGDVEFAPEVSPSDAAAIQKYLPRSDDPTKPQAHLDIINTYVGIRREGSIPGEVHRVEEFMIRPWANWRDLAPVPDRVGNESVYAIGVENAGEGAIVGDGLGRIFLIDQAGEWFIGGDIDEALVTLLRGREQRRIRDDGTW